MGSGSDFVVIGAGIAGASVAWELQRRGSVRLLEREPQAGAHTTGRSAAFLVGSYGNGVVQRLTRAGRAFLESPPEDFSPVPVTSPRPSLTIARPEQLERLEVDAKAAAEAGVRMEWIGPEEATRLCPVLRPGHLAAAVLEPDSRSIDVAALLESFLRGFRARGGELLRGRELTGLVRRAGVWELRCGAERYEAPVVVDAAGAWGDVVAGLAGLRAVGLRPLRRTALTFDPPAGVDIRSWPCVLDAEESFYLKPMGVQLLASPCDETPSEPCDARPDELAVALAVDRVQRATTLAIPRLGRCWAGLRSFVADRAPVIGMDGEAPGFFWLVGQGGFGIMTSPAAARAAAGLIVDGALPGDLRAVGLQESDLSPERPALTRARGA